MGSKIRKLAIVGTGRVGSSCAYAMINPSVKIACARLGVQTDGDLLRPAYAGWGRL